MVEHAGKNEIKHNDIYTKRNYDITFIIKISQNEINNLTKQVKIEVKQSQLNQIPQIHRKGENCK